MQLGLFSVSYAGYWGQDPLSLEAFIAKAAALGFDTVMLAGKRPHLSPLDLDDERLSRRPQRPRPAGHPLRRRGRVHRSVADRRGRSALSGNADRVCRIVVADGVTTGRLNRSRLYGL